MSADSYYRKHRNRKFEPARELWSVNVKRRTFKDHLLAGEIEYFEITQDCNGYSSYSRCYYQPSGGTAVFQEVPMSDPGIMWKSDWPEKNPPREAVRYYMEAHEATWQYIRDNFDRVASDFHVQYRRKKVESKVEEVLACQICAPNICQEHHRDVPAPASTARG